MALQESQVQHLNRIKREFNDLIDPKFIKGAEEHKTLLHEMSPEWLLDAVIEEILDLATYALTLKEVLNKETRDILEGRG